MLGLIPEIHKPQVWVQRADVERIKRSAGRPRQRQWRTTPRSNSRPLPLDQFGKALVSQPAFTWTLDNPVPGESIGSSSGVYLAPVSGQGKDTVRATAGTSGKATVTYAQPPIITSAGLNPNPATGKTTQLTAVATDPDGVGGLLFTWSLVNGPAGVTFDSKNGTTSGNNVTATFSRAGTYTLQVSVKDSFGLTSTQTVTVTVKRH
jgi:hypothetical protein